MGLWIWVSDIRKTFHIVNKQKIATFVFLSIECDDKVWVGSDVYKCNAHLNKNIDTQVINVDVPNFVYTNICHGQINALLTNKLLVGKPK